MLAHNIPASVTSAQSGGTVTAVRPPRILIVDDTEVVRVGLRLLLTQQTELQLQISEAENGEVAVEQFRKLKPDVVVLDLIMPVMGGLAAAYQIRKLTRHANIIFISSHYSSDEASALTQMLRAPFVPKSDLVAELVPTIKHLLNL